MSKNINAGTSCNRAKKTDDQPRLIPIPVRIFFGISLFLFCTAIYQSVIKQKLVGGEIEPEIIVPTIVESGNGQGEINTVDTDSDYSDPEEQLKSGMEFLRTFYQVFSSKDATKLRSLIDNSLWKYPDINQFFIADKIIPFIDGIEGHQVEPTNIQLLSVSPSGTEEYQYELNYSLLPEHNSQIFKETRITKVKNTSDGYKLMSVRCDTPRCSYNPFFWPQNYGL